MFKKAQLFELVLSAGLVGCSSLGQSPAQPLPTVVLEPGNTPATTAPSRPGGGVTASGIVAPAQQARLSFTVAGRVRSVEVEAGDSVKAGQTLATLDDAGIQAQLKQADAAVAAAQANYDLLAAGPTEEDIQQAEAGVVIATANYSRTLEGPRPADTYAAQAALNAAYLAYNKLKAGPQPADYAAAEANLKTAERNLQQAHAAYDPIAWMPGIGARPEAVALEQATNAYAAAKAALDLATRPADAAQLAAANQQIQSARAALNALQNPSHDFDVAAAQAQVDQAEAHLAALRAGGRPEQLKAAQAEVTAAQAARSVLENQLENYRLVAPIDGLVASRTVEPGETVLPGGPVLVVANTQRLRVETTDLSERDVPTVQLGQSATVIVKPLAQSVTGKVIEIAPLADTLGGDVVYRTIIELDNQLAGLRPGMSVEVQFGNP